MTSDYLKRVEAKLCNNFRNHGKDWLVLNMKCGDRVFIRRIGKVDISRFEWDIFKVEVNWSIRHTLSFKELVQFLADYRK